MFSLFFPKCETNNTCKKTNYERFLDMVSPSAGCVLQEIYIRYYSCGVCHVVVVVVAFFLFFCCCFKLYNPNSNFYLILLGDKSLF